ncbi:ATP-binding protein [Nocardioides hungaricus]
MAEICRRLDGLPLALELVAPWVRVLSLQQILERMTELLEAPQTRNPPASPRHRTLRSLVASTWELCGPDEQRLWSRLSVFPDSFDLAAAEAICAEPTTSLLDTLASLLDQSVVVLDETRAGPARYRLLHLTRDFAARKLRDPAALRAAHRTYFCDMVEESVGSWTAPHQLRQLRQLSDEYANVVAAIDRGLGDPSTVEAALQTAGDLWLLWFATGRITEGRSLLRRVMAIAEGEMGIDEVALGRARLVHAYLCVLQGAFRAAEDDLDLTAVGRDPINVGMYWHVRAMLDLGRGDLIRAGSESTNAIAAFESCEDRRQYALLLDALGVATLIAVLGGEVDRAADLGRVGLLRARECGEAIWTAYFELTSGIDAWLRGEHAEARARAVAALTTSPDAVVIAHGIELLAWCAADERRYPDAATLFGAADRRWLYIADRFVSFTPLTEFRGRCLSATRGHLPRADYKAAYQAGGGLTLDEVVAGGSWPEGPHATGRRELSVLTPREVEVARLVASGQSNRQIAETLTISTRTVESHVDHALTKLGFTSRVQLAAWMVGTDPGHPTERRIGHGSSEDKA